MIQELLKGIPAFSSQLAGSPSPLESCLCCLWVHQSLRASFSKLSYSHLRRLLLGLNLGAQHHAHSATTSVTLSFALQFSARQFTYFFLWKVGIKMYTLQDCYKVEKWSNICKVPGTYWALKLYLTWLIIVIINNGIISIMIIFRVQVSICLSELKQTNKPEVRTKCVFLFLKLRWNLAVGWGLERERASHPARGCFLGRSCLKAEAPLGGVQRCLAHYWHDHTNKEECVVANRYTDLD